MNLEFYWNMEVMDIVRLLNLRYVYFLFPLPFPGLHTHTKEKTPPAETEICSGVLRGIPLPPVMYHQINQRLLGEWNHP